MIANPASGQPAAVSGRPAAEPAVRVAGLRKHYGGVVALGGVELTVARGEFFTLLGPSGSGKTTLLRLIAGFEQPDAGQIELAGRIVTRVPPYARNVNTVFQDYALFPHMTVAENIEYALRVRRMPKPERREKAGRALEMVRLSGLGHRKPAELSGGQRQRVALARAIVNEPEVLLLDEPLGALDLKLRQEMQLELQHVQREVGITFLYVTHDQEEALSMSDRIAVPSGRAARSPSGRRRSACSRTISRGRRERWWRAARSAMSSTQGCSPATSLTWMPEVSLWSPGRMRRRLCSRPTPADAGSASPGGPTRHSRFRRGTRRARAPGRGRQ